MKTLRVYDINLSPETQAIDTEIGAAYRRVTTMLYTLNARGADAKYLNLHRDSLEQLDADMLQLLANPSAAFAGSGCNGVCSSCHSACGVPADAQQA